MCGKTLIDPFFLLAGVASVACLMGPTTSKKSFLLNRALLEQQQQLLATTLLGMA